MSDVLTSESHSCARCGKGTLSRAGKKVEGTNDVWLCFTCAHYKPELRTSNLEVRIDALVSKLLDWTEHDSVALRRSAASLLRAVQAELARPAPETREPA